MNWLKTNILKRLGHFQTLTWTNTINSNIWLLFFGNWLTMLYLNHLLWNPSLFSYPNPRSFSTLLLPMRGRYPDCLTVGFCQLHTSSAHREAWHLVPRWWRTGIVWIVCGGATATSTITVNTKWYKVFPWQLDQHKQLIWF